MKHYILGALLALPLVIYMIWHAVQVDKLNGEYWTTSEVNIEQAINSGGLVYEE